MKARHAFHTCLVIVTSLRSSQVFGFINPPSHVLATPVVRQHVEERMLPDLIGPAEAKVRLWLNEQKTGKEVFEASQVPGNALETLKSPEMEALMLFFSRHSNENKKLIEHFTELYGDKEMADALITLKQSENEVTKNLATILLDELLEGWINSGKSILHVLQALKLHGVHHNVLADPLLQVLEQYIELFNTATSSHRTLLDALIEGLNGEDNVAFSIGLSKLGESANEKALELETLLIEKWKHEEVHPAFLLRRLHLDTSFTFLLCGSIDTVQKYIVEFNRVHPNEKFSLVAWFSDEFEDHNVAAMLVMAQYMAEDTNVATTLMVEQSENWWKRGYSMDKVFRLLKIPDDFSAPGGQNVYALDNFIKFVNEKTSSHETLLNVLTKGFGGVDKVVVMIEKAQDDYLMKKIATKLKRDLLEKWLHDEGFVDQVVTLLKVKEDGSDVLSYWKLPMLNAFLAEYNAKYRPKNPLVLGSVLRKSFGESGFAIILAKTRRSSTILRDFSQDNMKWLFGQWMENHIDPTRARSEIFKDANDDEIDEILRQYAKFYNKRLKQVLRFQDPRRS